MFHVCPRCGEYSEEKVIEHNSYASSALAICPACYYAHPFLRFPLFVITGASGAGKSAICRELARILQECVVLETDILWGLIPATPEKNYTDYHNVWLRLAKNIGQAGRAVVLCGTATPENCEVCPERRYFSTSHYLALVCDDRLLGERLRRRPAWRKSGTDAYVQEMQGLNRWFKEQAEFTYPPITLYDTSSRSIPETTRDLAQWIRQRLWTPAQNRL